MKIFFLHFFGMSSHSGISKKILYQTEALKRLCNDVELCYLEIDSSGNQYRVCGEVVIEKLGSGFMTRYTKWFRYRKLTEYILDNCTDVIYIRSFYNTTPQLLRMLRKLREAGIKIVMEFPTFPYDEEVRGGALKTRLIFFVNKLFRSRLKKFVNKAVTFSEYSSIHGIPTIRISNGIDFSAIPVKQPISGENIQLIGVADIHIWHGFDRVIMGLRDYYSRSQNGMKVYFNIVGDGDTNEISRLKRLASELGLVEYVYFSGYLSGELLDQAFNNAVFAIASLARHRTNISNIKTLKNREYAARGIPFAYSEVDEDFEGMPYVLKVKADDSAINISNIIDFLTKFNMTPVEIRNTILNKLSWDIQMKEVMDKI